MCTNTSWTWWRARSSPKTVDGGQQTARDRRRLRAVHRFLLYGFVLLSLLTPRTARGAEMVSMLWRQGKPAPGYRTAALAPDGSTAAFIGAKGRIQAFSRDGKALWEARIPEADALVIGARGAIAFPRMNPDESTVYLLNDKGEQIRKHELHGTIWCASLDGAGKLAAVGTGSGQVYLYTIGKRWASHRYWRARGIPSTISCSPDGRYLAAGTYEESGVATYRPSGSFLWRYTYESPAQYFFDTQISPSGKLVMSVLQPNPGDQIGRILLWTADGKQLLDLNLRAYKVRAMLSQNEKVIAVTCSRQVVLSKKRVPEQKVTIYDQRGKLIWEKGGLFFFPTLVSVAPDGKWVLCHDGETNLYLLGDQGRVLTRFAIPAKIRTTLASTDGRTVLVVGTNEQLYLLKVGR